MRSEAPLQGGQFSSSSYMRKYPKTHLPIYELDLRENPINPISLTQNLMKTSRKPDKPDKPDGLKAPKGRGSNPYMRKCPKTHLPIHDMDPLPLGGSRPSGLSGLSGFLGVLIRFCGRLIGFIGFSHRSSSCRRKCPKTHLLVHDVDPY